MRPFLQSSSWIPQRSKPGLIIRCQRRHDTEGVELLFTKSFLSITPGEVAYYCFEHNQQKRFRDFQPEIQLNYEEIIDFQTIKFQTSYLLNGTTQFDIGRRTYISTQQETYEFSDAASQKRLRQLEVPNLRFGGDHFTLDVINASDGGNGEAFDRSAMTRVEVPPQQAPVQATVDNASTAEALQKFFDLKVSGAISEEEYAVQKKKILGL
jgi:hypothetical protein